MNNKEIGKKYEERAAEFLKERGMDLLEQNYACRQGEVDLIGIHDTCLVFVEVKYRKNDVSGTPEEAVGIAKQRKICRVSDYYRICHENQSSRQIRYDVVAVTDQAIRWYPNAFSYTAGGRKGW